MYFRKLISKILCIALIICNISYANGDIDGSVKMRQDDNALETNYSEEMNVVASDSEFEEDDISEEYEEELEEDLKMEEEPETDPILQSIENEYVNESEENTLNNESTEITESEEEIDDTTMTEDTDTIEESISDESISDESIEFVETTKNIETTESTDNKENSNNDDEINVSNTVSELKDLDSEIISTDSNIIAEEIFNMDTIEALVSTLSDAKEMVNDESPILSTISDIKKDVVATKSTFVKGTPKFYGYLSSEFKAKLSKKTLKNLSGLMTDDALPSSYDSREQLNDSGMSIIPPVRNQGNYGTCWAFSTIGMIETSLRSKNLVTDEEASNLSEAALAYFTLNLENVTNSKNIDKPGIGGRDYSEVNVEYYKLMGMEDMANFADAGGNQTEALLIASTYMGALKENADTAYSNMPSIKANGLDGKYAFNNNDFELLNVSFMNKGDRDLIKKAIMENGSVGINYCEARESHNCHKFGDDYYYFSNPWNKGYANHAVMIVG